MDFCADLLQQHRGEIHTKMVASERARRTLEPTDGRITRRLYFLCRREKQLGNATGVCAMFRAIRHERHHCCGVSAGAPVRGPTCTQPVATLRSRARSRTLVRILKPLPSTVRCSCWTSDQIIHNLAVSSFTSFNLRKIRSRPQDAVLALCNPF